MKRVLRDNFRERSRLREYVEAVFLPYLETTGASKSQIERHAAALEYVERFVKSPLRPEDLDELLVNNFDTWLWKQALSDGRRRDLVESIRRIVRAYQPKESALTKRCSRRPLPDPPAGTVRHFYETVYAQIDLIGRTARYVDENRATFIRLYQHFGRDITLTEQTDQLAALHFGWLLEQGLRPATINTGHRAVWFAVWRRAHALGLVDKLPTVRSLPVERQSPDAWDVDELGRFLESCNAAAERPIDGVHAGNWWRAVVHVAYHTALRRRAILAIRRSDVDLKTSWLRTPGSSMKNRQGMQHKLSDAALVAIGKIWSPEREYLFPFPYDRTTFYKQFHRIREAAGLAASSCSLGCLHKLRRSSATEAARHHGIGAAQTLLGHSSPRVTERYIDPSKMPGHDFTNVLPPLGRRVPIAVAAS